jgi:hypothetical protein
MIRELSYELHKIDRRQSHNNTFEVEKNSVDEKLTSLYINDLYENNNITQDDFKEFLDDLRMEQQEQM